MLQRVAYSDYMKHLSDSLLDHHLRPYGRVVFETNNNYPIRLYIIGQTHRHKDGYNPLLPQVHTEVFRIFEMLFRQGKLGFILVEGLTKGVDYNHRQWKRRTYLAENFPRFSYSDSEIAHLVSLSGMGAFDAFDSFDLASAKFGTQIEGYEIPEDRIEHYNLGIETVRLKEKGELSKESDHFHAYLYMQGKRSRNFLANSIECMEARNSRNAAGTIGMLHILEISRFVSQGRIEISELKTENYQYPKISEELPHSDFTIIIPEARIPWLDNKLYQWV